MNRKEFISRLSEKIDCLPYDEKKSALSYYEEILDDAGAENEQSVINNLGSIDELASNILRESGYFIETTDTSSSKSDKTQQNNIIDANQSHNSSSSGVNKLLIILLIIVTFPLWIGFVAGAFGIIIGIIAIVFGLAFACFAAPIGIFVAACFTLSSSPVISAFLFGLCLLLLGIVFLLIPLIKWTFKMIGKLFSLIGRMFKNIFGKVGNN